MKKKKLKKLIKKIVSEEIQKRISTTKPTEEPTSESYVALRAQNKIPAAVRLDPFKAC